MQHGLMVCRLQMKESKNDYRDRLSKISQDLKRRSTEG
jgi:hypothetical protein